MVILSGGSFLYAQNLNLTSGQMFAEYAHSELKKFSFGNFSVDKHGRYIIEPEKGCAAWETLNFPINESGDYSIEAVLEQIKRKDNNYYSMYGILFGYKDTENYYEVLLSDNGKFCYRYIINGIWVNVIDWTYSKSIRQGNSINKIKIWKHNQTLYIAINGQLVASPDALSFFGEQIGFYTQVKGAYALWNLKIEQSSNLISSTGTNQTTQTSNTQTSSSTQTTDQVQIAGSGTGFAIDKRGYFATNYHVVDSASAIGLCLQINGEWQSFSAKVIRTDPTNDIAIIKIDDERFTPFKDLPYSFSYEAEDIASEVFTLGYPWVQVMGTDVKYTSGVINSRTGIQGDPTHYQISAHIDHGNSGGPLFNSKGQIIAITDSGLDKALFGDVNYAVKSMYLKSLIDASGIDIQLPNDQSIIGKSRPEQIKEISPFVALILIAK